jgi:excinuclease ABC subunit A
MVIRIEGAREHNLQGIDLEIGAGLTAVTGISGSGKTSLVFDTLYHEARRRFLDVYTLGRTAARLVPADVDAVTGLGPAVAVGQNLLNRNPASTIATASGLHPFLRLLYANFGERGCPRCGHFSPVLSEDEILARLVALAAGPRAGDLEIYAPLVRDAVGSHRTLLELLAETFGSDAIRVDGQRWSGQPLPASAPHSVEVLVGLIPRAHAGGDGAGSQVASLRRVIQDAAQLGSQALVARWDAEERAMARAPICVACGAWLEAIDPTHFHRGCPRCDGAGCEECAGTGLHPAAAAVRWEGLRLTELLALTVDVAQARFAAVQRATGSDRLVAEIESRLAALGRVGLGYVSLDRPAPSLSRGEAQRVRLALVLLSRLQDMLHVLDEPTVGQHPADVQRLLPAFRDLAGPVVFVEHDRAAVAAADRAIDLGPGAGSLGGRLIYEGTAAGLWAADTPSGRYFGGRAHVQPPARRPPPEPFITILGAALRNLQDIDVPIPLSRLTVVTGVSGSGKSTLVEDVLAASLIGSEKGSPDRATGCRTIEGATLAGRPLAVASVDQSPIGRNTRSNPATYTKLADIIRDLYAAVTGLSPSHFSFNRPEGACPACGGLGAVEVAMRYLPDEWIPCAECEGMRFSDEVLAATVPFGNRALSIADFYALSIADARRLLAEEKRLPAGRARAAQRVLEALDDIGLGFLPLGQSSTTLSGGEAQRVKLAKTLGGKSLAGQLVILDEPSTGLHPQDLAGLLTVLDRLVRAGATVVVVEHDMDVMRAADWIVDLGPGSGPRGGRLLYAGPPDGLFDVAESVTGRMLREDLRPTAPSAAEITETAETSLSSLRPLWRSPVSGAISVRGARAHNLADVDVDFPKGKLTVVTGVSGSGKSSLVHDVLEAEARRRFLESLTLYERQGTREGPEAEAGSVTGLGVALTVTAERVVYQRRATVGTATELTHYLAVLLAEIGARACDRCGAAMARGAAVSGAQWRCPSCGQTAPIARPRHFSPATYAAACRTCHGVGTLQTPRPEKLIVHPEKPLCDGAMYSPGFFPNGYLCQPYNGGYYMVQALADRYGFDPCTTPWREMTAEAQHAFLFGDPAPLKVTAIGHSGRVSEYTAPFPGFYGWIRDWDVGGTYTDTRPCPECAGAGLRPEYLVVRLGGHNAYGLSEMPLSQLAGVAAQLSLPTGVDRRLASGLSTVRQRLHFLEQVGLGYLHLGRVAGTLSAGEAQRIRLAGLLGSGLTSLTILLDEPTRGLHPREVGALVESLHALRDEGNTVIVVEHDPTVIRAADHLIDVGPGAGADGGLIVAQGSLADVARSGSLTGQWLAGQRQAAVVRKRREPSNWLTVRGARANNLAGDTVRLPLGVLVGICGVSGSGKSTLMIDTVGRALTPRKQTTSVAYEPVQPGEHDAIEVAPAGARGPTRAVLLDQSRTGVHSPAAFLDLTGPLRTLYMESEDARALGLGEAALSTSCSACGGAGVTTLDMGFLPDVHVPCETCQGTGYQPEAWQVRVAGVSLPELYGLTIDQAYELFAAYGPVARGLRSARELGLGYLVLRQPGYALSGGEAQRLKIARELLKKAAPGTLYILDEPSLGQHLEDVARLMGVLHRLVDAGASVMVVEHHPHILAACDWLLELGPGGGPEGGRVIASGTPEAVAAGSTPIAPYLREVYA